MLVYVMLFSYTLSMSRHLYVVFLHGGMPNEYGPCMEVLTSASSFSVMLSLLLFSLLPSSQADDIQRMNDQRG